MIYTKLTLILNDFDPRTKKKKQEDEVTNKKKTILLNKLHFLKLFLKSLGKFFVVFFFFEKLVTTCFQINFLNDKRDRDLKLNNEDFFFFIFKFLTTQNNLKYTKGTNKIKSHFFFLYFSMGKLKIFFFTRVL